MCAFRTHFIHSGYAFWKHIGKNACPVFTNLYVMIEIILNFRMRHTIGKHKPQPSQNTSSGRFLGSLRAWREWAANTCLALLRHSKLNGIILKTNGDCRIRYYQKQSGFPLPSASLIIPDS